MIAGRKREVEEVRGMLDGMGQRVPSKLIEFGRALDTAYCDGTWDGWAYLLEKPEKWATEYTAWANAGYPQDGDAEWDAFVARLDEA